MRSMVNLKNIDVHDDSRPQPSDIEILAADKRAKDKSAKVVLVVYIMCEGKGTSLV